MVENYPHVDDDVSLPSTLQGHQIHAFDTTPVIKILNAPNADCKSSLNAFYSLDS